MKFNQWTLGLAAVGVVSLGSAVQAEEAASQVLTAVSGTTLSGYVNTSGIWKFGTGTTVVGRAYDGTAKQDSFNLDVVKVTLEKPLEEAEWAAGYKVDMLYGPDAERFNAYGSGITSGNHIALQNAYVALRAPVGNGLDFKVGAYDAIIGYEVFDAGSNPTYSRSYGYTLEPVQHVGVLASYRINDLISFSAGVANTAVGANTAVTASAGPPAVAATPARAESIKTYMAGLTLTAPESMGSFAGSTFYAGVVDGMEAPNGQTSDTTWIYSGVTLRTPWEQLSLGAAFDYRFRGTDAVAGTAAGNPASSWAYAVAAYASYQVTEKLKFNNRVDYTQGTDGTYFVSGTAGGNQNELISYTGTLDYQLWEHVITRAEFRWDSVLSDGQPYGMTDENAMSIAANIIYKF